MGAHRRQAGRIGGAGRPGQEDPLRQRSPGPGRSGRAVLFDDQRPGWLTVRPEDLPWHHDGGVVRQWGSL